MYRNTEYYAPQPVRPTETQLFFRHNSFSAGFSKNFGPVENALNTTSITATSQYDSSLEAGGSSFLGAMGQAGYAASGGPSRIEPAAFNTYGLDPTLTSASFENASWSSAGSVQGPLTHVNLAWIPNANLIESPVTAPAVPSSEAQTSAAKSFTCYPVFPEEHYRGPSQQLAQQNTAPGTSSRQSGLDFHSTLPLLPGNVGSISSDSLLGGSLCGSSFPPRVIAPMPHQATPAFTPYNTPLGAAIPASGISPLHTMLSTWQHASGTSNLDNALEDYGFVSEKQAIDEPYFAPVFDSGLPGQAAAVTESSPTARVEHAWNMQNQAFSPSTVLDQSTGQINSFEEGVVTKKIKFSLVTGGGSSTSSDEAAVMTNTKRARHGQRFYGSTVRSEAAKKIWRKRKAMGAPLAPSMPKRARSGPSPHPGAANLPRFQDKNQRTIASATEGTSFNQQGVKAYVSYPLPGESVVHKDKGKEVIKMKMNKRKLEDVPVRRVVPCD